MFELLCNYKVFNYNFTTHVRFSHQFKLLLLYPLFKFLFLSLLKAFLIFFRKSLLVFRSPSYSFCPSLLIKCININHFCSDYKKSQKNIYITNLLILPRVDSSCIPVLISFFDSLNPPSINGLNQLQTHSIVIPIQIQKLGNGMHTSK